MTKTNRILALIVLIAASIGAIGADESAANPVVDRTSKTQKQPRPTQVARKYYTGKIKLPSATKNAISTYPRDYTADATVRAVKVGSKTVGGQKNTLVRAEIMRGSNPELRTLEVAPDGGIVSDRGTQVEVLDSVYQKYEATFGSMMTVGLQDRAMSKRGNLRAVIFPENMSGPTIPNKNITVKLTPEGAVRN